MNIFKTIHKYFTDPRRRKASGIKGCGACDGQGSSKCGFYTEAQVAELQNGKWLKGGGHCTLDMNARLVTCYRSVHQTEAYQRQREALSRLIKSGKIKDIKFD